MPDGACCSRATARAGFARCRARTRDSWSTATSAARHTRTTTATAGSASRAPRAAARRFHNRGARPGLRVRLVGPPANPDGIGAQIRVMYGDHMGPVREVQAGSGYWSENGAVQVFGLSGAPTAVWVRWPGGGETRAPVAGATREVTVKR